MPVEIAYLLVLAFAGLLFLLRLDAQRFGAAEYDDETGGWRAWLRRLTWLALGMALTLLIFWLYPLPISELHLDLGPDRQRSLILGLLYGAAGTIAAFLFAWLRYRRIRLPSARQYPGAILNSVGTALLDEVLFRGVILGALILLGLDDWLAVALQAVIYAVATRPGLRGRGLFMLLMTVAIALASGALVLATLGIGAAVVGHGITRFAFFLATGHRGPISPPGWEPEEVIGYALPPQGWDFVGDDDDGRSSLGSARPG